MLSNVLRCTWSLHTCVGPLGNRLYLVHWQGGQRGPSSAVMRVGNTRATQESEGVGFGFLSDVEAVLDAEVHGEQDALDGAGVCVFVDASEMSSNQPHVMSAWAEAMLEQVMLQHGDVAVVRFTEWAVLASASKGNFLAQRAQH